MSCVYFAPSKIEEALVLMQTHFPTVVAGGTDIFPAQGTTPMRRSLLDVSRIDGMTGIDRQADGSWRIGAATCWTDIVTADLPPGFAGLQAAGREVGSLQIRNAGTIGGNICNASPAADGVPPLLTLEAEVEIACAGATRMVPLSDFLTGVRQTTLGSDEILVAVHIPAPPPDSVGRFEKLGGRSYLVISITMTATLIGLDEHGCINLARIAVGACSPVARRLAQLETDLIGQRPDQVVVLPAHLKTLSPISDVRADAVYRAEAVAEQIKRAVCKAAIPHD
ncbi:Nicotinate dehydrogenase FAD-subunit [Thalassovita gelatinovora]|uniref:Nicotinate dehydrogenase FAD-subunit n=1 Tax=Thalassovita gelatinovora TaxID=53501 RepID=A0A0P1FF59_THAGE|nr:FAD binding domain-containing protein [Thalassovita gelatinovora]CUH66776.1 Nicotinate dehydrogenase FAD-subunit [Thalassovita gelatinovora]SEQ42575.1 CO or xanthine dehydrogenase, FAD-binding subunit [Thalassovita gelatinovora]